MIELIKPPDEPIVVNPVHEPSGVGVLPVRTAMATPVPVGRPADHVRLYQFTTAPASNTRDVNTPDAGYGLSRCQSSSSTNELAGGSSKSLAASICIGPVIARMCRATWVPSMKYTTSLAFQSIRYRCEVPSHVPGIAVLMSAPEQPAVVVRANSCPVVALVLKIAHGSPQLKFWAKPECWNASGPKFATNSSECVGMEIVEV